MSKSNLKLAEAPPPRTPERVQLTQAIADRAAAGKEVERVRQAHRHAEEVWLRSVSQLDAAHEALERAKGIGETERLAAAALNEAIDGVSISEAEAAVAQAQNDKDVAMRTGDALRQRLAREEEEVTRAKEAIERAVAAVVRSEPAVAALAEEQEKVNRRLAELNHIFSFLGRHDACPVNEYGFWPNAASASVVDPWRAAIAQLHTDPDAALPTG